MGVAQYFSETATNGVGRTVYAKGILTNHRQLTAAHIGNVNIRDADNDSFGVNGTFFYTKTYSVDDDRYKEGYREGHIYRIMLVNGAKVNANYQPKSDMNRFDGARYGNCGTFMVFENPVNGRIVGLNGLKDFTNFKYDGVGPQIPQSNIRFAVGGNNLLMDKNIATATDLNKQILANDGDSGDIAYRRNRTAIVYFGGTGGVDELNTALITIFDSAPDLNGISTETSSDANSGMDAWDLRKFIQNKFGTGVQMALMLDGGGSTQLVYKENLTRKACLTKEGTSGRGVRTMIRTPWTW